MPLRDLALIAMVVGSLPVIVIRPYVGVLVWTWLAFMNPHRLMWGPAQELPFSQAVAAATLLGLLVTSRRSAVPMTAPAVLLAAFWVVTVASTLGALYPEPAWGDFTLFSKIVLMTFVMIVLVQTRAQLRWLLLVCALSIGFYGAKGAAWTLLTGGESGWVLGPRNSFFGDNNGLALALNMTIPLLFFLARQEPPGWFRLGLFSCCALSIVAVPFTYARGGFLGLALVLFLLFVQARWKPLAVPGAIATVALAVLYLPDRWWDRISSIFDYRGDSSAMSRLQAWSVGFNLALDHPVLGGGFRVFPHREVWARYAPDWVYYISDTNFINAHSIYFHVLGEHGFLGLGVYLTLIGGTLAALATIRRRARRLPGVAWMADYSRMIQVSLYAFLVTGLFYNMTYFDLVYFLIGVTVIMMRLLAAAERDAASATMTPSGATIQRASRREAPRPTTARPQLGHA